MSMIVFFANVIYFVYHASINQRAFDLIITTLQNCFGVAKLRLNSIKTQYIFISRNNSLKSNIEHPADAKFSNNASLLYFNLDSRLSHTKHANSMCQKCYYLLRIIYYIKIKSTGNR